MSKSLWLIAVLVLVLVIGAALFCLMQNERRQYPAADAYVKECYAWSEQMTLRGERIGDTVFDVIEGKTDNAAKARDEIESFRRFVADEVASINAKKCPTFRVFRSFRATFLEYLEWERTTSADAMDRLLDEPKDPGLTRQERAAQAKASINDLNVREQEWKRRVELSVQELYRYMNARD